jgi:AhpD family alkylhydroperoxidase
MGITPQERELVAIGIAVASGCRPCVDTAILAAREDGANPDDIANSISVASDVRRAATSIIEDFALRRNGVETAQTEPDPVPGNSERIDELVSVGASFALNCVPSMQKHVDNASAIGISREEIMEIVKLGVYLKDMAASHVEHLVSAQDTEDETNTLAEYHEPFDATSHELCAWSNLCRLTSRKRLKAGFS